MVFLQGCWGGRRAFGGACSVAGVAVHVASPWPHRSLILSSDVTCAPLTVLKWGFGRGFVLFCFRNFLVTIYEFLHHLGLLVATKNGLGKKGNLLVQVTEKYR